MGQVYNMALRFKKKHPSTVGWRLKKNASIVEKHLNPGEKPLYVFVAQKNDNPLDIMSTFAIVLTNRRIVLARKRLFFGYLFTAITPDLFNDLKVTKGIVWGRIYIDTVKEFVPISNIDPKALPAIETKITEFIMNEKRKMGQDNN